MTNVTKAAALLRKAMDGDSNDAEHEAGLSLLAELDGVAVMLDGDVAGEVKGLLVGVANGDAPGRKEMTLATRLVRHHFKGA